MFWIKLQTTTSITSNDRINHIIKAEDNMKAIQNSTIMCLWRVCVRSSCVGKVSGLNNAVPTSIQKQTGIRPHNRHPEQHEDWRLYLCQGRAHSGRLRKSPSHHKERASTPDFPWLWKSECPTGSHGSTIHVHPGQPHTHSVVELAVRGLGLLKMRAQWAIQSNNKKGTWSTKMVFIP